MARGVTLLLQLLGLVVQTSQTMTFRRPDGVGVDQLYSFISICPLLKGQLDNVCRSQASCSGRCGHFVSETASSIPAPLTVTCSCDSLCEFYGDCCWDANLQCSVHNQEFKKKYASLIGFQSTCLGGYSVINSCPKDYPMEQLGAIQDSHLVHPFVTSSKQPSLHFINSSVHSCYLRAEQKTHADNGVTWDRRLTFVADTSVKDIERYIRNPLGSESLPISSVMCPPPSIPKARLCDQVFLFTCSTWEDGNSNFGCLKGFLAFTEVLTSYCANQSVAVMGDTEDRSKTEDIGNTKDIGSTEDIGNTIRTKDNFYSKNHRNTTDRSNTKNTFNTKDTGNTKDTTGAKEHAKSNRPQHVSTSSSSPMNADDFTSTCQMKSIGGGPDKDRKSVNGTVGIIMRLSDDEIQVHPTENSPWEEAACRVGDCNLSIRCSHGYAFNGEVCTRPVSLLVYVTMSPADEVNWRETRGVGLETVRQLVGIVRDRGDIELGTDSIIIDKEEYDDNDDDDDDDEEDDDDEDDDNNDDDGDDRPLAQAVVEYPILSYNLPWENGNFNLAISKVLMETVACYEKPIPSSLYITICLTFSSHDKVVRKKCDVVTSGDDRAACLVTPRNMYPISSMDTGSGSRKAVIRKSLLLLWLTIAVVIGSHCR